jgi:hypothetical protein
MNKEKQEGFWAAVAVTITILTLAFVVKSVIY